MKTNYLFPLAIILLLNFYGNTQACFTSASDYVSEGAFNGQTLTKGDYDNDGDLDVVIASLLLSSTSLYYIENNGDGTFQTPIAISSNSRPLGPETADLNNDGNLDVVVSNNNASQISVLLGNGDGTFMAPQTFTTSAAPNSLIIEDFNGDGDLDVAVATNTSNVDVFLMIGHTPTTVSFDPKVSYNVGFGFVPSSLGVADITDDGNLDLITANNATNTVSIMDGDGLGAFGTAIPAFPTGLAPNNVQIADFNGDGFLDVVTSNEDGNSISILLNDQAGGLDPKVDYSTDDTPYALEVNDYNGDTFLDIVAVNNISNTISVFNGVGDGTFNAQNSIPSAGSPADVVTGDFDGDGNEDIVLSTLAGGIMPVYLGDGAGNFEFGDFNATGNTPKAIFNADFNNDGNLDYVVVNSNDNNATVYEGAGDGTFSLMSTLTTGIKPVGVTGADLDGNGSVDIIVADSTDGTVSVFLNTAGVFSAKTSFNCNAEPLAIKTGDINNDGNADIIVVNENNQFSVLLGNGAGSLGAATAYATGNGSVALDVADVNGDNFDDVVIAAQDDDEFNLFTNNGAGIFTTSSDLAVGNSPSDVRFGDLNNDGFPEIITTNYNDNNFTIHNNNGSGAFSAFQKTNYTSSDTGPLAITFGDFDGDGNNDIIITYLVSSASTGVSSLYLGDGTLAVTFSQRFATGINPVGIANGDFNNDGNLDYSVVNQDNNNVSVHLNTTPSITASGPTTFCSGGDVDLVATTADNYEWSNGLTTQTINVTAAGSYTVETTSQSGWCSSTSQPITVTVTPGPTLTQSGSTTICSGQSTSITIGGATTYSWDNGLGSGATKSLNPTSTTTYNVEGTTSGCTTSLPVTVTVNALPDASFTTLNAAYCVDASTVTLVPTTSGGTFSGGGVSGTTFDPSSASIGSNTITYNVTDGNSCSNSSNQSVTVNALPDASFTTLNAAYCADATSVTLVPTTSGGAFSGGGVSGTTFDPSSASIGSNTVTYSVTDGNSCSNSSNQTVTVNALPDASFTTLDPDYCVDAASVTLTPTLAGGAFSGGGVSGTTFDPSSASIGSNTVTYSVTDGNSCSNSSNQTVTVNALPDASFTTLDPEYCIDAASVTLTPTLAGGTFSGGGVSGTTFDPSNATLGSNTVTYNVSDANSCSNSSNQTVTVNALPDASFTTLDPEYCANASSVTLVPTTTGGTFGGDGVLGNIFDPTTATIGTVIVSYTLTDANSCSNTSNQSVDVLSLPDATFTGLATEYCADVTSVTLVPTVGSGTFSGDGVSGSDFNPSAATPGNVSIIYTITDANNCTNSEVENTIVFALPDATFTTLNATYCKNDANVVLTPNQAGGAFVGSGVANGNEFAPSIVLVGNTSVDYIITDANNCSSTTTQTTEVLGLPNIATNYSGAIIESEENSVGATYQWVDCDNNNAPIAGETDKTFTPSQNGNYAVVVSNGNCSDTSTCVAIADVSINNIDNNDLTIEIYPNPNNGRFNIVLNNTSQVNIYDAVGKLVLSKQFDKGISFIDELSNHESGMYIVDILDVKTDSRITKKVIVQH